MTYRDEREALRAQVEHLEEQLEAAEARLAEARQRDAPAHVRIRVRRVAVSVALVALVAGAGGVVIVSRAARPGGAPRSTPTPRPVRSLPVATATPPPPPALPPPPPQPARVVAQPSPPTAATPAPDQTRGNTARWHATVRSAQGIDLAAGTDCTLDADVSQMAYGRYRSSRDNLLTIACGARVLYRWADPVRAGIEQRTCNVAEESTGEAGNWRYRLRCSDLGVRSGGRPELEFDTNARQVSVRQSGQDAWRVELAIEPLSVVRAGDELQHFDSQRAGPVFDGPVQRTGRVTAAQGAPPPARLGTRCDVRVEHEPWRAENCRVRVRCGGAVLYGAGTTGFARCTVADNAPVAAHDTSGSQQDHDPALSMDLHAGTIELVDEPTPGRAWSLVVTLDPPPDAGTAR